MRLSACNVDEAADRPNKQQIDGCKGIEVY
jgi:hypothetical protein